MYSISVFLCNDTATTEIYTLSLHDALPIFALYLLFGVPLPIGGLITAVVAFVLLAAQSRGHRPFERVITGLLLVIGLGFAYTLAGAGVDVGGLAGGMVPSFAGSESLVLATGILGATVMPHVIYVHSALTPGRYGDAVTAGRTSEGRRRLLRAQRLDVLLAMGLAGLVNAAMLVIAAQLFTGRDDVDSLEGVHAGLGDQLGAGRSEERRVGKECRSRWSPYH